MNQSNNSNTISVKAMQFQPILDFLDNSSQATDCKNATGALRFSMINDALFHIVFEADSFALKGFLSALLHMSPDEITSVEVTNPIRFGDSIYAKSFVLDLKLLLNHKTVIDLEMQVERLKFWKERSIGYLCRAFDNLNKGDGYLNTKPAVHIGILDFDLFPEQPEFYATYHLSNDITHKKYSDSFRMSVLQLRHSELATDDDRLWQLDLWAKFIKADTWEVIHTLAEKNPYIASAAQTIYRVTEEDYIRNLCEGREEGEKTQRTIELLHQIELQQMKETLQQKYDELLELDTELQQKDTELQQKDTELQQKDTELQQKDTELQQKDTELQQKDTELQQANDEIARLRAELDALKK